MWSKPVYTNRKSASAERCLRALGATLAMGIPVMRRSKHSRQGVFSHQGLRKASAADAVNTGLAGSAGMAGMQVYIHRIARERAQEQPGCANRQGLACAFQGQPIGQGFRKHHRDIRKDVAL